MITANFKGICYAQPLWRTPEVRRYRIDDMRINQKGWPAMPWGRTETANRRIKIHKKHFPDTFPQLEALEQHVMVHPQDGTPLREILEMDGEQAARIRDALGGLDLPESTRILLRPVQTSQEPPAPPILGFVLYLPGPVRIRGVDWDGVTLLLGLILRQPGGAFI